MATEGRQNLLSRSMRLLFVYALAAGAMFTGIDLFSGSMISFCGPAILLTFIVLTPVMIVIALPYSELTTMLPSVGGELIFNTVGMNKHLGFLSAWSILLAWLGAVPGSIFAIISMLQLFIPSMTGSTILLVSILVLLAYTGINLLKNVVAGSLQTFMLIAAISGVVVTAVIFYTSKQFSFANLTPFFRSILAGGGETGAGGIKGWFIGTAIISSLYFGFEIVPQMVEEGTFPIKDNWKAIIGSIVTCGVIYLIIYTGYAGMGSWEWITDNGSSPPFVGIKIFKDVFNWYPYAIFYGLTATVFAVGTCLLGFWVASARLIYAMARQNFLPGIFEKVNKFQQPIFPNVILCVYGIGFMFFMFYVERWAQAILSIMVIGCSIAYLMTTISCFRLAIVHPEWKRPFKTKHWIRVLAILFAGGIMVLTFMGQTKENWIFLGIYYAAGFCIWLWMLLVKWRKQRPMIETPDGAKEY